MKRLVLILFSAALLLSSCAAPQPKPEPEKATFTGTVVALLDGSFILRGADGELEILTDADTLYLDRGGQAVKDTLLENGSKVTVTYTVTETEPQQVAGEIVVIESAVSTQVGEGIGALADCTEPPVCRLETTDAGEVTLTAGSYDWSFPSGSGEMTSIVACGVHPMDDPESLPTVNSADALYLHFDYTPQRVTARYWSADDFGNLDAQSQETSCTATSLPLQPGLNCYELTVTWQAENGTGGTAYYVFTASNLPGRIS